MISAFFQNLIEKGRSSPFLRVSLLPHRATDGRTTPPMASTTPPRAASSRSHPTYPPRLGVMPEAMITERRAERPTEEGAPPYVYATAGRYAGGYRRLQDPSRGVGGENYDNYDNYDICLFSESHGKKRGRGRSSPLPACVFVAGGVSEGAFVVVWRRGCEGRRAVVSAVRRAVVCVMCAERFRVRVRDVIVVVARGLPLRLLRFPLRLCGVVHVFLYVLLPEMKNILFTGRGGSSAGTLLPSAAAPARRALSSCHPPRVGCTLTPARLAR